MSDISIDKANQSGKVSKGSPSQRKDEAYKLFLVEWEKGLDPLEIATILEMSITRALSYSLDAYRDHVRENDPKYRCMLWEKLPKQIKKVMPGEKTDVLRIEGDSSGVTITKSPINAEKNSVSIEDDSSIKGDSSTELSVVEHEQSIDPE